MPLYPWMKIFKTLKIPAIVAILLTYTINQGPCKGGGGGGGGGGGVGVEAS